MPEKTRTRSHPSPLNTAAGKRPTPMALPAFEALQRLYHELKVHQCELEMQNEELLRVAEERQEMEKLLGRYSDLYDFAPAGYFNLDKRGFILTVNLTGAGLLGDHRYALKNQRLDAYLSDATRPYFHEFLERTFASEAKESCEVVFQKQGYPPISALIEGVVSESREECRAVVVDMTECRRAEQAHLRLAAIVESSDDAIISKDLNGLIIDWNAGAERLFGYGAAEVINKPITLLMPPELRGEEERILHRLLSGEQVDHFETVRLTKGGRRVNVSVTVSLLKDAGRIIGASKIARDITERTQSEAYGEMNREILQILNVAAKPRELIDQILASLKKRTGFHGVAIRLQDREDFPYSASRGFPKDFLLSEKSLVQRSDTGAACREENGQIRLECICGLVLSGKTNPENPLFSRGGSFWTNDASRLLDIQPRADLGINPRSLCAHRGYTSVALVPIRSMDRIIGLIQLNDRRKGRLTRGIVELMEGIGSHIGAALARKQSEERHLAILRTAMDGFWLLDTQGYLVEVNETYCQMSGYSSQELLTMHVSDVEASGSSDGATVRIRKVLSQGAGRFESLHRRKDGTLFDVEASVQYQPVDGGRIVTFLRDITERKQAETYREMGLEILKILNKTTDLHDSLGQVIATLKQRGAFAAVGIRLQDREDFPYFAQEGFPRSFLLSENTLLQHDEGGRVCRDADGKPSLECACGMVISGKADPSNPLFTAGGSFWTNNALPLVDLSPGAEPKPHLRGVCLREGYASLALVPIRSNNKIVGLIQLGDHNKDRFTMGKLELLEGIASHIGGAMFRSRAEADRGKLEAQLQHSQKMESVGRLAGGVAHDFNNMLSVIIGHANLALMELEPVHPVHVNMEEIRKAAERSADLTRQLLAFARKQTVVPRVVDLNEAVSGILVLLKRLIGEQIDLQWQPGPELWSVKIDPSQIDQILANLCVNARDAITDVGKITIETKNIVLDESHCRYHATFVPGEYVHLAVSDNGHGMDKETVAHIFEPFFTTKGVGEGTGLGLSTVYGAARQNNGFIQVCSEPGLGTTLTLYLPRHVGRAEKRSEVAGKPASGGAETILVVEDEPAILDVATVILKRLGYHVLATNSPEVAMRQAQDHLGVISLLLTDVIMPEMNGRDLAKQLLALHPRLKRLFMSGYTSDIIAHHGVLDEGVHFIQKPFTLQSLAAKVREVLDA